MEAFRPSSSGRRFFLLIVGLRKGFGFQGGRSKKDEDLDFVYKPAQVAGKANKTHKLLEFLARQDESMKPEILRLLAETTFRKLQECWQARSYEPMEQLLMPDLYARHCSQIRALIREHEINYIADLRVDRIDIVNVRYTDKPDDREFTALITARAGLL